MMVLFVRVIDVDDSRGLVIRRKETDGVVDEGSGSNVNEEEFGAAVAEKDRDGARVKADIDRVEHRAAHRHAELHLVHGRDVGRQHGDLKNKKNAHKVFDVWSETMKRRYARKVFDERCTTSPGETRRWVERAEARRRQRR